MRVVRNGMRLTVIREPGDPVFRGGEWGSGESRLLYHVKKKIIAGEVEKWGDYPTDFIKKRMWKDGHMVDDAQLYLRSRKHYRIDENGYKIYLSIRNTHWAINGLNDDFNQDGCCCLQIEECTITKKEIGKHSRR